jgi:iron complex outermembrane receptor protein
MAFIRNHTGIAAIITAILIASGTASAQAVLEEITVTAQKREQSLQDVPVFVSAVTADTIQAAGLDSVGDVQLLVPALNVYSAGFQARTSVTIRGAGTGAADPSLEPSVGIFVDGMYMPRSVFGLEDLVDVERIEVLMGPQGTLYGKNTNSGVISVTTKGAPTELEGHVTATFGDYNQQDLSLSVASPLSDTAGFRLGVLSRSRDGVLTDVNTGQDLNSIDNTSVRGQFYWDASDSLTVRAIGYYSKKSGINGIDETHFEPTGSYLAVVSAALGIKGTGETIDTEVDNLLVSRDAVSNAPMDVVGGSLQLDYEFANGVTLTSQTSVQSWELDPRLADVDMTPLDLISTRLGSEDESFGQEIRLTSPGGESFDWMAGAFYFTSDLQLGSKDIPFATFGSDMAIIDAILSATPAGPAWNGLGFAGSAGHSFSNWSEHESESIAVYGQANWHLSEATTINFGLRYSDETKDFGLVTDAMDPTGLSYAAGGSINVLNALFSGVAALGPVINMSDSKSDDNVTGMLSVNHFVGDHMLYASVATGTKSGGFNGSFGGLGLAQRAYDTEKTISYEIGGKFDGLLDGRARVNVALFYTDYDDFQATVFEPSSASFLVDNAGQQVTQGIDIDATWLATDNLTLSAAVEFLDAKYKEFEGASCHPLTDAPITGQTPTSTICDLSGFDLPWASDWSGSLSANYVVPLDSGSEFFANITGKFSGDITVGSGRPPYAVDSKEHVNARIGWRNDNWDIAIWAKNLTDHMYRSTTIENTMSAAILGPFIASSRLVYNSWNVDPRTYGITARYYF